MGTGTIQVLIYGHMGTGTIWVSFRSVSVVCWLIGDLTVWFVGCDPHPVFMDICFISVNEQFWTRTPFFCRCEVRNHKLRIRVIDLELLGDLTFWFVCGCDSHPVLLYPPKKGLLLVIGLRGTLTNLLQCISELFSMFFKKYCAHFLSIYLL